MIRVVTFTGRSNVDFEGAFAQANQRMNDFVALTEMPGKLVRSVTTTAQAIHVVGVAVVYEAAHTMFLDATDMPIEAGMGWDEALLDIGGINPKGI